MTDEVASFQWTNAGVQALHREFSHEMSREVKALAGLSPQPWLAPPAGVLAHV